MGGALISGSLENSFFGNRTPELNEELIDRLANRRQYKNSKLSLALGKKIISNRTAALDVGIILKRHPDIKRINPGSGFAGRIWKLHFGASLYQDDFHIGLEDSHIQESTTYTAGTRLGNFAFDVGSIRSNVNFYGQRTNLFLYSGSFHYRDFLFNYGLRNEESAVYLIKKKDHYGGVQYSLNRHLITGLQM